jgi:hypothetical protein
MILFIFIQKQNKDKSIILMFHFRTEFMNQLFILTLPQKNMQKF